MPPVGKRWLRAKRKDPFWRKAKREGFRSRAAYKLQQLDDKFHVLGPERVVIDLGAAPGGWSQVAVERCPGGKVVGVDLAPVPAIEGAIFLRGDFTDPAIQKELLALVGKADTVLSDMSPNISGAYGADHARSIFLAEKALAFATTVLRFEGDFLVKVFEGDLFPSFVETVEKHFDWVKPSHPPASRSSSSEIYVVAKRFKGSRARVGEQKSTPQELAGRFDLNL
jgi:23S rRNA (uridine2552-2'-O)-methyltransferase